MKLREFFVILSSVLTFLGECRVEIVASRLCPVRAEPVGLADVNGEVRCACAQPFHGESCELKGKLNANYSIIFEDNRVKKIFSG